MYVITNLVNGKQYVGVTANPAERERQHLDYLHLQVGSKLVKRAVKKYGRSNFRFTILAEAPRESIFGMEQAEIARRNTLVPHGYNLTAGGEGSVAPVITAETRQRMSEAQKARCHTEAERQRCRTLWVGRKHREETRRRMSLAAKASHASGTRKCLTHSRRGRPVIANGVRYSSVASAANSLGIKPDTLRARLRYFKSVNKWPPGWRYEE